MKLKRPKHLGWIITAFVLVVFIGISMIPTPLPVDLHTVTAGPLFESIDAEGQHTVRCSLHGYDAIIGYGITYRARTWRHCESGRRYCHVHSSGPRCSSAQFCHSTSQCCRYDFSVKPRSELNLLSHCSNKQSVVLGRTKRLQDAGAVSKEQSENAADAYITTSERVLGGTKPSERPLTMRHRRHVLQRQQHQALGLRSMRRSVVWSCDGFQDQENTLMAGQPLIEIGDPSTVEVIIDVLKYRCGSYLKRT